MMQLQKLTYSQEKSVVTVSFQNVRNDGLEEAATLSQELGDLVDAINWDDNIRVVVVDGLGRVSRGTSSNIENQSQEGAEPLVATIRNTPEIIRSVYKPSIAVIKDTVVDEMCELAIACDLRIAGENSSIGLTQVIDGDIPAQGGSQLLPRLIGKGRAMEMILTGATISAQEAFRIGLVNRVVADGDVANVAKEVALEISAKAPLSLRFAKEAVEAGLDMTLLQGLRLEADLYLLLHTTADRTSGIRSFLKKKSPDFQGR